MVAQFRDVNQNTNNMNNGENNVVWRFHIILAFVHIMFILFSYDGARDSDTGPKSHSFVICLVICLFIFFSCFSISLVWEPAQGQDQASRPTLRHKRLSIRCVISCQLPAGPQTLPTSKIIAVQPQPAYVNVSIYNMCL